MGSKAQKRESPQVASRATIAQMEGRVTTVMQMLLAGAGPRDVFRYAAEKTDWGVGERQLENYIAEANAEICRAASADRETAFGIAIGRLNQLYNAALKIQDYKTCLAIQKEISAMHGLK